VQADTEVQVNGIPNEFSQVILNILMNAKDALLERKVAAPRVKVRLFSEDGNVVLTISDNGGGIPPEIMDKIFDPYFTTKGPDKGTGIGLFMSKTIIEKNMNGTLSVRNTKEGAEFRIEV
jgi:C4-dicarboxylate-specific signal transduction histidine kinase